MEVLEEKEEEERREEEELKALGVGDSHQDVETKASVEPVCVPSNLP